MNFDPYLKAVEAAKKGQIQEAAEVLEAAQGVQPGSAIAGNAYKAGMSLAEQKYQAAVAANAAAKAAAAGPDYTGLLDAIMGMVSVVANGQRELADAVQMLLNGQSHSGYDEEGKKIGGEVAEQGQLVPSLLMEPFSQHDFAIAKAAVRVLQEDPKNYVNLASTFSGPFRSAVQASQVNEDLAALDAAREANLLTPAMMDAVAKDLSLDRETVANVVRKVISTGTSAALFGLTGNFPVAAMGYFAMDRILLPEGKKLYDGSMVREAQWNGVPLRPVAVKIPDGLPNEIFYGYRFICYDRVSGKVYPSDQIQVLNYEGGAWRWFCLDRLDGNTYHANLIKKPRIYLD